MTTLTCRLHPHFSAFTAPSVSSWPDPNGSDFPTPTERLLLELAANQATIGLQQALILSEQKGLTRDLDERVAQRTTELATANELLTNEIAQRRRTEEALRESERESRLIVDSIPGMIALLSATGDLEVGNRQLLEYFGQTLEQLRGWGRTTPFTPRICLT